MSESKIRIRIIGGSGLYAMDGITILREENIDTPFGRPSAPYVIGKLDGLDEEIAFLPRHGIGHPLNPSEVPYRANIFGMKKLGVQWLISVSAVGSLRENIVPGEVVLIDQFIDRTKNRDSTFFEKGVVAHVSFGDPICETLRQYLLEAANDVGAKFHDRGTYVCMEGPAFSTRAESNLYRSWGAQVIGMTNVPESKLAREAEMSYATLAMATDYDCWHEGHDDVTVDQVIAVLKANSSLSQNIIKAAIPKIAAHQGPSPQANALAFSLITNPDFMDSERVKILAPLIGKYIK